MNEYAVYHGVMPTHGWKRVRIVLGPDHRMALDLLDRNGQATARLMDAPIAALLEIEEEHRKPVIYRSPFDRALALHYPGGKHRIVTKPGSDEIPRLVADLTARGFHVVTPDAGLTYRSVRQGAMFGCVLFMWIVGAIILGAAIEDPDPAALVLLGLIEAALAVTLVAFWLKRPMTRRPYPGGPPGWSPPGQPPPGQAPQGQEPRG